MSILYLHIEMKILDTPRSGSVAGVTASRNRFGQYYRTRAIPVQPRTPKQTTNRAAFTAGSSAWRGESDENRQAWNDYAAQITRSGSLGSGYSPTGAQLFTGSSVLNRVAVNTTPSELPTYVLDVSGMNYVGPAPGPEALEISLSTTSATNAILVETSGPISPGVTSAASVRRWRSLPTSSDNLVPRQFTMTTTPVPILTNYKFLFPSPLPGNVIWWRFREIFYDATTALAPITNRLVTTFRLVIP